MTVIKQTIVKAEGLIKSYGKHRVVDRISFSIMPGEFCGILGPNGAGKTTTLKMLVGNTPMDAGTLQVMGYSIPDEARVMRKKLGIVPQNDNLDLDFTVAENLRVYGRYFGLGHHQIASRIPELLKLVNLADRADYSIRQLSGGMKRRLSIARALINRPELLMLDEPTTGLDPQVRLSLWQLLRQLQKEGLTIICTTHYMDEAERLCDRIILMDHGSILADESPKNLIGKSIERHVLEIQGETINDWERSIQLPPDIRREWHGESVIYYGDRLDGLVASLDNWSSIRYSYRPANLEDVFLKLTGRELRDG